MLKPAEIAGNCKAQDVQLFNSFNGNTPDIQGYGIILGGFYGEISSFVLQKFISIEFFLHHEATRPNSASANDAGTVGQVKVWSSANLCSLHRGFSGFKSLMNNVNRRGPITLPCGIPRLTKAYSDKIPFTRTHC